MADPRARAAQPTRFPEIPGDTTTTTLTRPIITYAVIRVVAVSAAVSIAYGLHLHYAFWMPLSTILAIKPSPQQSTLAAEQRLIGTILGAVVAAILLLTVHDKHALKSPSSSSAPSPDPSSPSTSLSSPPRSPP